MSESRYDDDENRIGVIPDGPTWDPTLLRSGTAQTATNAGIVLFAGASMVFCLRGLMEAFLIAMLIVIGLAISNILLLTLGRRQSWRYVAAPAAGAKSGGSQQNDAASSEWSKSQKVVR